MLKKHADHGNAGACVCLGSTFSQYYIKVSIHQLVMDDHSQSIKKIVRIYFVLFQL